MAHSLSGEYIKLMQRWHLAHSFLDDKGNGFPNNDFLITFTETRFKDLPELSGEGIISNVSNPNYRAAAWLFLLAQQEGVDFRPITEAELKSRLEQREIAGLRWSTEQCITENVARALIALRSRLIKDDVVSGKVPKWRFEEGGPKFIREIEVDLLGLLQEDFIYNLDSFDTPSGLASPSEASPQGSVAKVAATASSESSSETGHGQKHAST